jgi:hypothetical protein
MAPEPGPTASRAIAGAFLTPTAAAEQGQSSLYRGSLHCPGTMGKTRRPDMDEAEWLRCEDPYRMLEFLGTRLGDRKLRLIACACCRLVWDLIDDARCRQAVEVAERVADGLAGRRECSVVRTSALRAERTVGDAARAPYWAATSGRPADTIVNTFASASDAVGRAAQLAARQAGDDEAAAWDAAQKSLAVQQAALIRHLAGNPFREVSPNGPLPASVTRLAEALYAGADVAFALHDALLESDHLELADHFREADHPKGCWAVDLLTGRE